jgi:hypothetical protein
MTGSDPISRPLVSFSFLRMHAPVAVYSPQTPPAAVSAFRRLGFSAFAFSPSRACSTEFREIQV